MTNRLSTRNAKFLFAGVCIVIFLALSTMTVVLADPNSAYCVSTMGYLYRTTPSLNDGKGICQFPDGTWCDAHEFFKGNCGPAPYVSYRSYLTRPTDSSNACWRYGGRIQYVHTIYGDIPLCVSPDGRTINLPGYGGTSDAWAYYAYSWLNAP
jgi:putative hemolysin